mmetsp:Transcript_55656/g.162738  ORF Transcript_55656/g.162738 Transcript_55656/m.162738 type:complete len:82 (+) Transcript_55656:628-873(+)
MFPRQICRKSDQQLGPKVVLLPAVVVPRLPVLLHSEASPASPSERMRKPLLGKQPVRMVLGPIQPEVVTQVFPNALLPELT